MALSRFSSSQFGSTLLKPYFLSSSIRHRSISSSSTETLTVETSIPFTSHNCEPPSTTVQTTASELMSFFNDMVLMRRMEIAADSLYKAKLIRGFCHLYDGQEAVAVGMEAAINRKDCVITAYRDHCTFLCRGGTLIEIFSELMGRKDGCSKGKGGSMHFYRKEGGFYGGHGIVGAQIPLGVGLAFGQKYNKDPNVTFALYGDGAANQGQLFEALNIAALWDLPAILVCENNHYGMGTAEWRSAKSPAYYKRGDYAPGLKVDGMDVLAVKQACKFAKEHALKNGPLILEMDTYRYHGHSMSDPGSTYRTRDEISGVRQERDPIERVRKLVLAHDISTEKELKDIEKDARKQVDEAIAKAKESQMPDPSDLFTNVYVKGLGVEMASSNDKMEGLSFKWSDDPEYEKKFCELCVKFIRINGRGSSFKWKEIHQDFEEAINRKVPSKTLKNKLDTMKKDWRLWKFLKYGETGLGWDPVTGKLSCSDEWWDRKIKEKPEAKKYRNKSVDPSIEEYWRQLFDDNYATGEEFVAPSMDPELVQPVEHVNVEGGDKESGGEDNHHYEIDGGHVYEEYRRHASEVENLYCMPTCMFFNGVGSQGLLDSLIPGF